MKPKQLETLMVRVIYVMIILAMVLSVTGSASAASFQPFVGVWQAIDNFDKSLITVRISGSARGLFHIMWKESYLSFCEGQAGLAIGKGHLDPANPYILIVDMQLKCLPNGSSVEWQQVWQYRPAYDVLASQGDYGVETIWTRPGQPLVPRMGLRVNYGSDWVESFYEAGHTVWITVTDSYGTVKATAEVVTEIKEWLGWEPGFETQAESPGIWDPEPPDIQPNDWVYAQVDNGQTARVQIGDISGMIDLENDSIGGTVTAPWFGSEVDIECHSWGAPLPEEILMYDKAKPDGIDTYSCSWEGFWDILAGQDVGVAYSGPDGNWVANVFVVPLPLELSLRVNYGADWVEGFYEAGHTVRIIVTDSDGTVKATAEVVTEIKEWWGWEPGFATQAESPDIWDPEPPDIQPNDWVYAQVDNGQTAQVQIGDISGMIDLENDSIGGTVTAPWFGSEVDIECHPWGAGMAVEILMYDKAMPNGDDPYSCSWEGFWDILAGQDVGVAYSGPDGNWVANVFVNP